MTSSPGPPADRWRRLLRLACTPWVAAIVVLSLYAGLSFANDPRGLLSTDTGIKVATLRVMHDNGTIRPDLGYWAAAWDPEAAVHPYLDTRRTPIGYVDATTLPMLVAAYPLWSVGGYRATLVWPMLGALAAAFVARALARRVGAPADGWPAFWLVALASPMVVYALDLWEHTAGVALMGAAVLALVAAVDRTRWWHGLAAGAAFGAAYSMRTETLVYTATSFALAAGLLVLWRRFRDGVTVSVTGVAGFAVLAVANAVLERALIGDTIRSGRATGTAGAAGSDLGQRAREAVVTSVSPFPTFDPVYLGAGAVAAAALVLAARWGRAAGRASPPATRRRSSSPSPSPSSSSSWSQVSPSSAPSSSVSRSQVSPSPSPSSSVSASVRSPGRLPMAAVALGVALLVVTIRWQAGAGFWPGLLPTTPLAAVGLALGWHDPRRRLLVLLALVPLPLVFLFQFPGGALPQWAGRYLLVSGFLLMVVGAASLPLLDLRVRAVFVGLAVVVTASGVAWMSQRTHQVAVAGEVLARRPEQVLISPDGFPPREFAAWYGERDWLATRGPSDLPRAVDVVRRSGRRTFALVELQPGPPREFDGFRRTGVAEVPFVAPATFTLTAYELAP